MALTDNTLSDERRTPATDEPDRFTDFDDAADSNFDSGDGDFV